MKFTINWLKTYLDTKATNAEIIEKLTAIGLEVEEVIDNAESLKPFIIAEVLEAEKHPDADRLKVCKVNNGTETLQIVCGAPNAKAGMKAVLAPIGSLIPNGEFEIKKGVIRGVESCGMMCSGAELGISADGEGIIELPQNAPVGKSYATAYGLDDCMIEIAITPNRQDCLGVYGIARDLAASGLGTLKALNEEAPSYSGDSPISVEISDQNCEQFTGVYISGVSNQQSPDWLVQRLASIGQKSINALVDITNFICFDLGRPLHVYDADKIGSGLNVRTAKAGEKISALDENEYQLKGDEVVISDSNNTVQALGGVIGASNSGCDENTKNVFLEIAYFNPVSVAKAGRKHGIITDSRYRFERGVDPEFLGIATNIATNLILKTCGGKAAKPVVVGKNQQPENTISFDSTMLEQFGGLKVSSKDCASILTALGFGVKASGDKLQVAVPSWRRDVVASPDLVEEILRIIGYDEIPSQALPAASGISLNADYAEKENTNYAIATTRRKLAQSGINEVVTWSFTASKMAGGFVQQGDEGYFIQNPISADLDQLRPSILPNMLLALKNNINRGNKTFKAFEVGPIFNSNEKNEASVIGEFRNISGILSGNNVDRNIYEAPRKLDCFDAKQALTDVISSFAFNTQKLQAKDEAPSYYHPGKSGSFALGRNVLGYFGELHPSILKQYGIKQQVAAFECFYNNIPAPKNKSTNRGKYTVSNLQQVERDFAFVFDTKHKAEEILAVVKRADKLISDAKVFDIFEGAELGENKRSIAINVQITPHDKTLEDSQIEAISSSIISSIQAKFSAELRN